MGHSRVSRFLEEVARGRGFARDLQTAVWHFSLLITPEDLEKVSSKIDDLKVRVREIEDELSALEETLTGPEARRDGS